VNRDKVLLLEWILIECSTWLVSANITHGLKCWIVTNALAYYTEVIVTGVKRFIEEVNGEKQVISDFTLKNKQIGP